MSSYKDIIVWLRLKSSFFDLMEDILSVYIYPEDSTCLDEDQGVVSLTFRELYKKFSRNLCIA